MRSLGVTVHVAARALTVGVMGAPAVDDCSLVEQVRRAGEAVLSRRAARLHVGYLFALIVTMVALHVTASAALLPYLSDLSRPVQAGAQAILVVPCALVAFRAGSVLVEPVLERLLAHWLVPADRARYASACWRAGTRRVGVSVWDVPLCDLLGSSFVPARDAAMRELTELPGKGLTVDQAQVARQLADEDFQGTLTDLVGVARRLA